MNYSCNDLCEHEICSRFCQTCQLLVLKPYLGKDVCQCIGGFMDEVIIIKCISYEHSEGILRLSKNRDVQCISPLICSYTIHLQGDNDSINGFYAGIWDFCDSSMFVFKRLHDISVYELNDDSEHEIALAVKSKDKIEVLSFNDDGYETSYYVKISEKFCGGFKLGQQLFTSEGFYSYDDDDIYIKSPVHMSMNVKINPDFSGIDVFILKSDVKNGDKKGNKNCEKFAQ